MASTERPAPRRHEVDDLIAATCAAALDSDTLVICNPFPAAGLPEDVYETVAGNARAAGVPVVVDLSSPWLERTLAHRPDIVKINDWELAGYVNDAVDGSRAVEAMRAIKDAGAAAVAVTRAAAPILVLQGDQDPYEIVPPSFPVGHREGCGDTMTGALAAGLAGGLSCARP